MFNFPLISKKDSPKMKEILLVMQKEYLIIVINIWLNCCLIKASERKENLFKFSTQSLNFEKKNKSLFPFSVTIVIIQGRFSSHKGKAMNVQQEYKMQKYYCSSLFTYTNKVMMSLGAEGIAYHKNHRTGVNQILCKQSWKMIHIVIHWLKFKFSIMQA